MTDYTYKFSCSQSPEEVFSLLTDVEKWWSGFYDENISGKSLNLNDTFSFSAGSGLHFSEQMLIEIIPNKKLVWKIIKSNLSFLKNPNEWVNTSLMFEVSRSENLTRVTFTHIGLEPQIECYETCSNAWSRYLSRLQSLLNNTNTNS